MADKKVNGEYLEEGIYIERKPALNENDTFSNTWHTYLVYRDGKGKAEVIRGGPGDSIELSVKSGVDIVTTKDAYGENDTPETRFAHKIEIGENNPVDLWIEMVNNASEIDSRIDYEINTIDIEKSISRKEIILRDEAQVCHSVVGTVLKSVGLSIEGSLPADIDIINLRGINTDLTDIDNLDLGLLDTLSKNVQTLSLTDKSKLAMMIRAGGAPWFFNSKQIKMADPLVLDTNKDGYISTIALEDSNAYFNIAE